MEQTTGVAVLATHLVTDRRALSQAWYGALHLAEPSPRPRTPSQRLTPSKAMAQRRTESSNSASARVHRSQMQTSLCSGSLRPRGETARTENGELTSARRMPASGRVREHRTPANVLAQRIAYDVARRTAGNTASSFAMRMDGGRVHVVVRGDGTRVRIVAVCTDALRSRVERALAQARFALAGYGLHGTGAVVGRGLRAEAA